MSGKANREKDIPWVYILITFAMTAISVYVGYKIRTPVNTQELNDHILFKDLLQTMLAIGTLLITLGGVLVYKIVEAKLTDSVEKKAQQHSDYVSARLLSAISYSLWNEYDITWNKRYLDAAIVIISKAYDRHAKHLNIKDRKYLKVVCDIRNNWGYYLAKRGLSTKSAPGRRCRPVSHRAAGCRM